MSTAAFILFGPATPAAAARMQLASLTGTDAVERLGSWGWSVRADVAVSADELASMKVALAGLAAELGCDHALICGPLATTPPRLVVMDVDSTVTTTEAIDLLAEQAGAGDRVATITDAAMRGELDFTESLRARVATLAGLSTDQVEAARQRVQLQPGAIEWAEHAAGRGIMLALLSGGFVDFVEPVAEHLGSTQFRANTLAIDADGKLTGEVTGEIIDRAAKARHLHSLAADVGIEPAQVMAVGDGANDLDMLAAAGLGVALCAKPVTAEQADVAITFPRLDALIALLPPESSPQLPTAHQES